MIYISCAIIAGTGDGEEDVITLFDLVFHGSINIERAAIEVCRCLIAIGSLLLLGRRGCQNGAEYQTSSNATAERALPFSFSFLLAQDSYIYIRIPAI